MDSNGWFIFQFCLSWTIFARILPSVVCHGQLWLEYIAVLSVADNIDWFITRFSLSWTILGGIFNGCVLLRQYWLVNPPCFFLSWTVMIGLSPCLSVVDNIGLVYLPMLFVMNKNGWYITRICLLWTVMVGISPSFFCRGQNWLVYQPD